MSRRRSLEQHRHSLDEIREIMNSMKNLAFMEARKLSRFLDAQHAVVQSIEQCAADFLSFHGDTLPQPEKAADVLLLLGSERGFCGNFNHAIRSHVDELSADPAGPSQLIPVGRKLYNLLEQDPRMAAHLEGASVLEEVDTVIDALVPVLNMLQQQQGLLRLTAIYHQAEGGIVARQVLPPFQHLLNQPGIFACSPVLNEPPAEFLLELTDHYLLAVLNEILYASFMAENHHRMGHLEAAIRHLDEQSADLKRRSNVLRQEEIVEEIEVILLSAASLEDEWHAR